MPLSEAERRKCVETLLTAFKTKKQAVQLSTTYPHITIEDSYAISTAVAETWIKAGAKLIGHKVGLTSKAMQASSQINEPDYGHLMDTMMIADGAKVQHADYCLPRVEAGLAAGVLGPPALGVAWLANRLGKSGVTLEAGHLILAGSFTRVVFAQKGDTLHGDFGPLGGVAVQFI